MSTDEDTNAARRGSESNDQLGLVERLRRTADELHSLNVTMVDAPDGKSLYREAADEIERLLGAVAAERERCARIVETQDTYGDPVGCWFETLAAKIRA